MALQRAAAAVARRRPVVGLLPMPLSQLFPSASPVVPASFLESSSGGGTMMPTILGNSLSRVMARRLHEEAATNATVLATAMGQHTPFWMERDGLTVSNSPRRGPLEDTLKEARPQDQLPVPDPLAANSEREAEEDAVLEIDHLAGQSLAHLKGGGSSKQQAAAAAAAGLKSGPWQSRRGFAAGNGVMLRGIPLDTLELVRRLEAAGLTTAQAEAVTGSLLDVTSGAVTHVADGFATEAEMSKFTLKQEATIGQFKAEFKRTQDLHFANVSKDAERLRHDLEKLRVETKYELEKLSAGQQLDLNLEKGRMREELQACMDMNKSLDAKLDREVNAIKTTIEANKYEIIKVCIGTLISTTAVGLAVLRIVL